MVEHVSLCELESDWLHHGEETAIKVGHLGKPAAVRFFGGGHLTEQTAEQVIAFVGALSTILQQRRHNVARQQAQVLRDNGDEKLQDEALGP